MAALPDQPFCTPLDIRLKHRRFTPHEFPDAVLFEKCVDAKKIIRNVLSKFYGGSSLQDTPWATVPIPEPVVVDPTGAYRAPKTSAGAIDKVNRYGFRALSITDNSDTVFTQSYVIQFTSVTEYTVTAFSEGGQGSGDIDNDFTSSNGDVVIESANVFGNALFNPKSRFQFSVYSWNGMVVYIAKCLATALMMRDHYGLDQEDELSTAKSYAMEAAGWMKQLLKPDEKDGVRLTSLGNREFGFVAMPFDLNILGIDVTAKGQYDTYGNQGEWTDAFNLNFNEDFWFGW